MHRLGAGIILGTGKSYPLALLSRNFRGQAIIPASPIELLMEICTVTG